MAQLPVRGTIQAAANDLFANKILAVRLYAAMLAATTIAEIPSLFLPNRPFLGLLPWPASILVSAWAATRWADWITTREASPQLPPNRYWSTVRAMLKYYIVLSVAFGSGVTLELVGASISPLSPAVGSVAILLGLVVDIATIWAAVRLSLVPSRAALGEGASIGDTWRITKDHFWRLFGLEFLTSIISMLGSLPTLVLVILLAGPAIHHGWIPPTGPLTMDAFAQWFALPSVRTLTLLTSIVASPFAGAAFFIFAGSLIRAARLVDPTRTVVDVTNPWHIAQTR